MIKNELIQLVKTLSGPEKRSFKLYCKKQSGPKDYLDLFEIIDQAPLNGESEWVKSQFKKKHPNKSFENTAQYLLRVTTDSLIQIRTSHDKWFQQYNSLMRTKVLFERSLLQEGYKELKRAQKLSDELQDNITHYQACRLELNYWSESGFSGMTEQDLVDMQMKAKSTLRLMHQIQEHYTLFELLRHRVINAGNSISDTDKTKLNDLLISELSLTTRGSQDNFESQKLYLLFQSFFFISVGDYTSSLKSFKELNSLFELNESIWNFPPYDYLSALEGILDSLRTIRYFNEMEYFINKVEKLLKQEYPEHFQANAKQIIYIYSLYVLVNQNKLYEAKQLVNFIPSVLLTNSNFSNYEKLMELHYYAALTFFYLKEFQKSNQHINVIMTLGKVSNNSSIYKASRLLHLLIHYELDNMSYLEYEIRSYKRALKKSGKVLKIEWLILKIIKLDPKRRSISKNRLTWKKMEKEVQAIALSKYEMQVLKYYDYNIWIRSKFEPAIITKNNKLNNLQAQGLY
ncbi:hypothetical protein D770_24595 [Flammeovirgaceae bacterium 311]|nr:hypothetical protein D770_24595 [Flammeovirgaceae bacterium 311]